MNRALWGEVSPALHAARIKMDDKIIYLFFYYDSEISEEDNESAECVATEVISDYPEHTLEVNILRAILQNLFLKMKAILFIVEENSCAKKDDNSVLAFSKKNLYPKRR